MNNLLIAVDCGKHSTKSVYMNNQNEERFRFRTKVQEVTNIDKESLTNTDLIRYEGRLYMIGDMVAENRSSYDLTKDTLEHRLCTYLAIAKTLQKLNMDLSLLHHISLALNIPAQIFHNKKQKDIYANNIQQHKQMISIDVNDLPISFIIDNLVLLPESMGTIYSQMSEYRNTRTLVVDIGGLNTSYCVYKNIVPEFDSLTSSNTGCNILRHQMASALNKHYAISLTDEDVEQVLQDKILVLNGLKQLESINIIQHTIKEHVKQIINFAKSSNITFSNMKIMFCGGGAVLLKDELLKLFPNAEIAKHSQFANVYSFMTVLRAKFDD